MQQGQAHGGALGGEFRVLRTELRGEGVEIGLRLGGRNARAKTRDYAEETHVARELMKIVWEGCVSLQVGGNAGVAGKNEPEIARENADDSELPALIADRLADDRRISGETAAPEIVAGHEDARSAGRGIGAGKGAGKVGSDAKDVKEV